MAARESADSDHWYVMRVRRSWSRSTIRRARSIRQEKAVQVFDFSCTLCLTVSFSHP